MKNLTVYYSTDCHFCHSAMEYLDEKGIEYDKKNIAEDPEARKFLLKNKAMLVPTFVFEDQLLSGYDKDIIEKVNAYLGVDALR